MKQVEGFVDYGQDGWNAFFRELGTSWRDKDYRFVEEVFDLSLLSGSLLDVGCGLGDGQKFLYRKCSGVREFHGCDISSHAIETCRSNVELKRTSFFTIDLMLDPFPRNYDTIICLQTLEHVRDPNVAFRKLMNAANDLLIISTPYKNQRADENHLWSFDEKDFKEFGCKTIIAQDGMNIFWLLDKNNKGYAFRGGSSVRWNRLKNKWQMKIQRQRQKFLSKIGRSVD